MPISFSYLTTVCRVTYIFSYSCFSAQVVFANSVYKVKIADIPLH